MSVKLCTRKSSKPARIFQWDAVDASPDIWDQNVPQKTFEMVIRHNGRTTRTELERVFCHWIYSVTFKNIFFCFFSGGGAIATIVPTCGSAIGLCWTPLLSVESVVYLRLFSSMLLAPTSTAECSLRSQHREACLKLNSTTLARPDPTTQSSRTSSETRVWSGPNGPRVVEFSCYYWTLVLHATSSGHDKSSPVNSVLYP